MVNGFVAGCTYRNIHNTDVDWRSASRSYPGSESVTVKFTAVYRPGRSFLSGKLIDSVPQTYKIRKIRLVDWVDVTEEYDGLSEEYDGL